MRRWESRWLLVTSGSLEIAVHVVTESAICVGRPAYVHFCQSLNLADFPIPSPMLLMGSAVFAAVATEGETQPAASLFYFARKSETANRFSLIIQATINRAVSDETETILLYFYRYVQSYSAVVH